MMETEYIKNEGLFRKCPICERHFSLREFPHEKIKFWFNKKLAIPCCSCFEFLEVTKELKKRGLKRFDPIVSIGGYIQRYDLDQEIVIKNLKKWGIL